MRSLKCCTGKWNRRQHKPDKHGRCSIVPCPAADPATSTTRQFFGRPKLYVLDGNNFGFDKVGQLAALRGNNRSICSRIQMLAGLKARQLHRQPTGICNTTSSDFFAWNYVKMSIKQC